MNNQNQNSVFINAINKSDKIINVIVDSQINIIDFNQKVKILFGDKLISKPSLTFSELFEGYIDSRELVSLIEKLFTFDEMECQISIKNKYQEEVFFHLIPIIEESTNKVSEVVILGTIAETIKSKTNLLGAHNTAFNNAIDYIGDAIIMGDHDGILIGANQKMSDLTGYEIDEIIGNHISVFFQKDDLAIKPFRFDIVNQGIPVLSERYLQCKNGNMIPIEMHSSKITNEYISIIRDISERKQNEKNIKDLTNRLIFVTKMERIGIIDYNVSNEEIHFNEEMLKILDDSSNRKYTKLTDWIENIHVDDQYRVTESLKRVLEEQVVLEFVYRIISINRAIKTIKASADLSPEEDKLIITSVDITNTSLIKNQLRESEQIFKSLSQTASSAIFIYRENFMWVNHSFEIITGYSQREALKLKFWEIIHPEHQEMVKTRGKQRIDGNFVVKRYEFKIVTKSGQVKWLILSADQINYMGQASAIGSALDITDRKEIEIKLKGSISELEFEKKKTEESESRFRYYMEQNTAVMLTIDAISKKIIFANNAASCFYGYSIDELLSLNIYDINTLSKEEIDVKVKTAIGSPSNEFIFTHKLKNGEQVKVMVNASPIKINEQTSLVLIIHDITEEIKSKEELIAAHDTYRNILNSISEMIYVLDVDGKFKFVNETAKHKYGYNKSDFINKTPEFLSAPGKNNMDSIKQEIFKAYHGETRIFEFWGLKKDGSIFPKEVILSPGYFFGEKVVIAIARDISLHKTMTNELISAKEKAEESDRLKSAFLANMSHEIRTPMNAILGFSELVQDREMHDEERFNFLRIISKSSYHLLNIINDIVDISKIQAFQIKIIQNKCRLNHLLDELLEYFNGELINLKKNEEIKLFLNCGLPRGKDLIMTDETRLRQILQNIIGNSIKFTSKGNINISYHIADDQIHFQIEDQGIGIPKQQIGKIFERFMQADDSISKEYGGTGLGLAISKACVELLGGEIWCDSIPNIGTSMYFRIPFIEASNN